MCSSDLIPVTRDGRFIENGRRYFLYETTVPGNGNKGHLYGTDLSPEEKDALVEYAKTL